MIKTIITALLFITALSATKPTVAILYFKNRSLFESKTDLNKALADIIITELTNQSSFAIIEREELERVATELDFSDSYLIDQSSAPQVGKVLGATYIFTGSYMVEEQEILVTMKMLKVETGEIVSGENLTGNVKKISKMIGKLSNSALKMLKKEGISIEQLSPTGSQKVTLQNLNRYNQSLLLKDKGELEAARKELQELAKDLFYADRTLKKIEEELQKAEKVHQKEMNKLAESQLTYMDFINLSSNYMVQMQYDKLYALSLKTRKRGIIVPEGMVVDGREIVEQYAVTAASQMKAWDIVITDGTAFLKTYPKSIYFSSIKMYVKQALQQIEKQKEVEAQLSAQIEQIEKSTRGKDCKNYQIAMLYYEKGLQKKAGSYFEKVDAQKAAKELPKISADKVLSDQIFGFYSIMDLKRVKQLYQKLEKGYPTSVYTINLKTLVDYVRTVE